MAGVDQEPSDDVEMAAAELVAKIKAEHSPR
jgi:hypothetical protein